MNGEGVYTPEVATTTTPTLVSGETADEKQLTQPILTPERQELANRVLTADTAQENTTIPTSSPNIERVNSSSVSENPANPSATNFYDRLGVSKNASLDEIKRAFRRAARRFHPDVNDPAKKTDFDAQFQALNEAYDTLRDEDRRAAYDNIAAVNGAEAPSPPTEKTTNESTALALLNRLGISENDRKQIETLLLEIGSEPKTSEIEETDKKEDPPENIEEMKREWSTKEVALMMLVLLVDMYQGGWGTQRLMEKWMRNVGFPKLCEKMGVDPTKFLEALDRSDAATFIFELDRNRKKQYLESYSTAELYELVRSLPGREREELLRNKKDRLSKPGHELTEEEVDELIIQPLEQAGGKYSQYVQKFAS